MIEISITTYNSCQFNRIGWSSSTLKSIIKQSSPSCSKQEKLHAASTLWTFDLFRCAWLLFKTDVDKLWPCMHCLHANWQCQDAICSLHKVTWIEWQQWSTSHASQCNDILQANGVKPQHAAPAEYHRPWSIWYKWAAEALGARLRWMKPEQLQHTPCLHTVAASLSYKSKYGLWPLAAMPTAAPAYSMQAGNVNSTTLQIR